MNNNPQYYESLRQSEHNAAYANTLVELNWKAKTQADQIIYGPFWSPQAEIDYARHQNNLNTMGYSLSAASGTIEQKNRAAERNMYNLRNYGFSVNASIGKPNI